MTKVAVGCRPFVPYAHAVVLQILGVSVAVEKPKQLVDDAFQMHFLCRKQWEAVGKVETHLISESGYSAGAGSVIATVACVEDMA